MIDCIKCGEEFGRNDTKVHICPTCKKKALSGK